MVRRHQNTCKGIIGFIIFVIFVGISGYLLAESGHFENPFTIFTQLSGGEGRGNEAQVFENQGEGFAAGNTPRTSERRGETTNLSWSCIGDVLFDLWFMCAATMVVMLIGKPLGRLIKSLRLPSRSGHGGTHPLHTT